MCSCSSVPGVISPYRSISTDLRKHNTGRHQSGSCKLKVRKHFLNQNTLLAGEAANITSQVVGLDENSSEAAFKVMPQREGISWYMFCLGSFLPQPQERIYFQKPILIVSLFLLIVSGIFPNTRCRSRSSLTSPFIPPHQLYPHSQPTQVSHQDVILSSLVPNQSSSPASAKEPACQCRRHGR